MHLINSELEQLKLNDMTILSLKKDAEKRAGVLGHELGKWKFDFFGGSRKHHTYCTLCHNYVVINTNRIMDEVYGTAIDSRPVRRGNGLVQVKDRCWGKKHRAEKRRRYTTKKKQILKAFHSDGIDKVITVLLGEYPIL